MAEEDCFGGAGAFLKKEEIAGLFGRQAKYNSRMSNFPWGKDDIGWKKLVRTDPHLSSIWAASPAHCFYSMGKIDLSEVYQATRASPRVFVCREVLVLPCRTAVWS